MDTGAWRATVHGVAKSWIQLSDEHTHTGAVGAFGWLILGKRRSQLLGLSACGFVCELKAGKDGTLLMEKQVWREGPGMGGLCGGTLTMGCAGALPLLRASAFSQAHNRPSHSCYPQPCRDSETPASCR